MQSNQDLNQNGIPDRLEAQQGFGFVGSVPATSVSVVDVREAPTLVERIEKPAVVHEVYKTEEVTQVQPIINREREQLDVYEVVQPMKEREVIATEVREAVLPAQTRATIVEDNSAFLAQRSAPSDFSTREVAATQTQVIQNAPIVHETINHRVIEEVQPVIYKEVDRPVLVKETLPIYEKVVEAPHSHHTVLPMRDLGVSSSTTSSFTTSTARVSAPMVTPVAAPIATPAAASYNAPTPVPVQSGLLYNSNILPGYSTTMVSSGSGMQQPLIRGDQLGYAPHNEEFLRMYGTTPSTALPQQQATKGTELNADNDLSRRLQAAMLNANTRI